MIQSTLIFHLLYPYPAFASYSASSFLFQLHRVSIDVSFSAEYSAACCLDPSSSVAGDKYIFALCFINMIKLERDVSMKCNKRLLAVVLSRDNCFELVFFSYQIPAVSFYASVSEHSLWRNFFFRFFFLSQTGSNACHCNKRLPKATEANWLCEGSGMKFY